GHTQTVVHELLVPGQMLGGACQVVGRSGVDPAVTFVEGGQEGPLDLVATGAHRKGHVLAEGVGVVQVVALGDQGAHLLAGKYVCAVVVVLVYFDPGVEEPLGDGGELASDLVVTGGEAQRGGRGKGVSGGQVAEEDRLVL